MGSDFKSVMIDPAVADTETAARATACSTETVEGKGTKTAFYRDGKKSLSVVPKLGKVLDKCATMSSKYACCNVHVLKSVSNCPYDCSYCFLQNYLNDGTTKVVADIDGMMGEVKEKQAKQPWRFFRIGTWELGDSLALERETGQAEQLIKAFSELDNAVLELKTKSDCVDSILDLDHRKKTVVSWSLNPEFIIRTQEHRTAPFAARLSALRKVTDAGYLVGLHFDPMILHDGWEENYREMAHQVMAATNAEQIAWISIGSLRFNPEMKHKMAQNFPAQSLTAEEMVLGDDGKMRYVKPKRKEMYGLLLKALKDAGAGDCFTYLCMERWDMWDSVLGMHPGTIGELDYLFAKDFYDRFPGVMAQNPDQSLYELHQND